MTSARGEISRGTGSAPAPLSSEGTVTETSPFTISVRMNPSSSYSVLGITLPCTQRENGSSRALHDAAITAIRRGRHERRASDALPD